MLAAPLLCQDEAETYFSISSQRTFGTGDRPRISLSGYRVSAVQIRRVLHVCGRAHLDPIEHRDNTPQTQQIFAELKILLNPNDTAFPANNNRWDKWLDEDVAYLISPQERAAFVALQSDAQREQFVNQFWERRNPTPGSLENSFKVEHYRRIAFANDRFAVPDAAEWQTDRGRVYILMGPPDEIDSHPNQNREMWRYRLGDITIEFDTSDRRKS